MRRIVHSRPFLWSLSPCCASSLLVSTSSRRFFYDASTTGRTRLRNQSERGFYGGPPFYTGFLPSLFDCTQCLSMVILNTGWLSELDRILPTPKHLGLDTAVDARAIKAGLETKKNKTLSPCIRPVEHSERGGGGGE